MILPDLDQDELLYLYYRRFINQFGGEQDEEVLGCCYGSIESLPAFGSEIDAHPLAPVLAR